MYFLLYLVMNVRCKGLRFGMPESRKILHEMPASGVPRRALRKGTGNMADFKVGGGPHLIPGAGLRIEIPSIT